MHINQIYVKKYTMDLLSAFGLVIFIILFAYVIMVVQARSIESSFLTGVWVGSPDFCAQSQLSAFVFQLSASEMDNTRAGYLLAVNDDGVILNNPVNIDFDGLCMMPHLNVREYKITIDWLGEEVPSFFPSEQYLTYDVKKGKIIMHGDDDTVYAVLHKNHDYVNEDVQD